MMQRILIRLAPLLLAAGLPVLAVGQGGGPSIADIVPAEAPAPEAYAALKMEDYTSVSNGGSGSLTVPLYALRAEGRSLPVTLSYDLGGIRAAETSTYVGLGWNLSLGASLTRTVTGEPDEARWGFLNEPGRTRAMATFFETGELLDEAMQQEYLNAQTDGYDQGPDAFSYRVGGLSGQFRFDGLGGILFQPVTNVQIEHADDLAWIDITAPDGLTYRFGNRGSELNNPVDKVAVGLPLGSSDGNTHHPTRFAKWHLTSVTDPAGHEYFRITYTPSAYVSEQQVHCTATVSTTQCSGSNTERRTCQDIMNAGGLTDPGTGSMYEEVYNLTWLPQVVENPATGRKITLSYADDREDVGPYELLGRGQPKRLRAIDYFDGDLTITKRLVQNYATTADAQHYYERKLLLLGIEEFGASSTLRKVETLEYELTERSDGTRETISRLTPYVDAWGYINSLSSAARPFDKRGPKGRYHAYAIEQRTDGAFGAINFELWEGQGDGLSKSPSFEGSSHASLTAYEDGRGARTEYVYGIHKVESYVSTDSPVGATAEVVGGAYSCGKRDDGSQQGGGCQNCLCPDGEERPVPPEGHPDLTCPSVPPDPQSDNFELEVLPGRSYLVRYELSLFQPDNRKIPDRNVKCLESYNDQSAKWLGGNILVRQLASDGSERDSWQAVFNGGGGPNGTVEREEIDLLAMLPQLEGITKPTTVDFSVFAAHGNFWLELLDVTPEDQDEGIGEREVGGVRLESVEVTDLITEQSETTEFLYQESPDDESTSGLLLREPLFGMAFRLVNAADGAAGGGECRYEQRSVTPDNPIAGFQGTHVEYTSIITRQRSVDRGYSRRTYREPTISVPGNFGSGGRTWLESLGLVYDPTDGELLAEYQYTSGGTLVASEEYTYTSQPYPRPYEATSRSYLPTAKNLSCPSNRLAGGLCGFWHSDDDRPVNIMVSRAEPLFGWRHELTTVMHMRDKVRWKTTYKYDDDVDRSLLLNETLTQNSTKLGRKTVYRYLALGTSQVAALAKANNQWDLKTQTRVLERNRDSGGFRQSRKYVTRYAAFAETGARSQTTAGGVVRANRVYELGTLTDVEQGILTREIKAYTPHGSPRVIRRYDDEADVEVKYSLDRVEEVDYLQYHTEATYFGNSSRAESTTAEDGQRINYAYDDLGRLSLASERGGKRETNYAYGGYTEPGSEERSWVETMVEVEPTPGSAITNLITRSYYSGLRQLIQTVHVNQLDGGGDRIEDYEYDTYGRPTVTYDVRTRSNSSVAFADPSRRRVAVETKQYAPDPLDRLESVIRPGYGSVELEYAASTGDLEIPRNAAFRTNTIDGEGYVKSVYTDVLGREIHKKSNHSSGYSVKNVYGPNGHLERMYRAWPDETESHAMMYDYDVFGRLIAKVLPESGSVLYMHDARGRLIAEQDEIQRSSGIAFGYRYDDYGDIDRSGIIDDPFGGAGSSIEFSGPNTTFTRSRSNGQYSWSSGRYNYFFGTLSQVSSYYIGAPTKRYRVRHFYDSYKRVNQSDTYIPDANPGFQINQYDHLDHVTTSDGYQHGIPGGGAVWRNYRSYNREGHLESSLLIAQRRLHKDFGNARKDTARLVYSYNKYNQVAAQTIQVKGSLWDVRTYDYDLHRNLIAINGPCNSDPSQPCELPSGGDIPQTSAVRHENPNSSEPYSPLFYQRIERYAGIAGLGITGRTDGRVTAVRTQMGCSNPFVFGYTYSSTHDNALASATYGEYSAADAACGLTPSSYMSRNAYSTEYQYVGGSAGLGRLESINRFLPDPTTGAPILGDALRMIYGDVGRPGRLTSVSDAAVDQSLYRAPPGGATTSYGPSGEMLELGDPLDGGLSMRYNDLGLPKEIVAGGVTSTAVYLADSRKVGWSDSEGRDHVSFTGFDMILDPDTVGGAYGYHWDHGDGYYSYTDSAWVFTITDYLGTPRVWFTDRNGDGQIVFEDDVIETRTHYPFGMYAFGTRTGEYDSDDTDFTGHRVVGVNPSNALSRYSAVIDMGARHYSPGLGRFLGVDPLADQFPHISPYAYTLNDPINLVDPTGMAPETVKPTGSAIAVKKLTDIIDRGAGGNYTASVDANGELQLTSTGANNTLTSEQQAFVGVVQSAIAAPGDIDLTVLDHGDAASTQVLVGDSGTSPTSANPGSHSIDVDDMQAAGTGGLVTEQSMLAHEVAEGQAMQVGGKSAGAAHTIDARRAESQVIGYGVGQSSISTSPSTGQINGLSIPVTKGFNNVQTVRGTVRNGQLVKLKNNQP